ncbi:MAG: Spi family protease inhibitor, partial [Candidatus Cloacimonetes bacterium]|nr:Spi family protease inhibitor [Candidatus Cloacimonadota bacterium]
MKRVFIILVLLANMALFAVPQDIEIAGQVAENFLDSRSEEVMISDSYLLDTDGVSLVYIFNTDPDGFVAVSADNDLYRVIAYSFKNRIFERDRDENLLHRM